MRCWALVAGLLLAGCSAPREETPAGPSVITDPRDLSYLANGTPGSHVHDYWQGRDQVEVLDITESQRYLGIGCIAYSGQEAPLGRNRPEDGNIVPQGTGELEILLEWSEDPPSAPGVMESTYTHFEFLVKTAQDSEPRQLDPPRRVENGVPFRIPSTNAMDDPPHYTLSLWEFQPLVVNEDPSEGTQFCGSTRVKVTAFRTLPLEVYPPHPDPWMGADELPLLDVSQGVPIHLGLGITQFSVGGYADIVLRPDAGAVVPYNTTYVEVVLDATEASGPMPLALQAHGSSTRTFTDVEPDEQAAGHAVYRIPVGDAFVGDSPYASQSVWEFRVHPTNPDDLGPWSGEWTLAARAVR